jgi:hypothetical protein
MHWFAAKLFLESFSVGLAELSDIEGEIDDILKVRRTRGRERGGGRYIECGSPSAGKLDSRSTNDAREETGHFFLGPSGAALPPPKPHCD